MSAPCRTLPFSERSSIHSYLAADLDELVPAPSTHRIEALVVPIEWMRYCDVCEDEQRFFASLVCVSGLIGCCTSCGDERIAPFTRTNSEAA